MVNHDSEPKYIIDTSSILSQKDDAAQKNSCVLGAGGRIWPKRLIPKR